MIAEKPSPGAIYKRAMRAVFTAAGLNQRGNEYRNQRHPDLAHLKHNPRAYHTAFVRKQRAEDRRRYER